MSVDSVLQKHKSTWKKGSDYHKTWNFLEILYIANSLELITEFVREFIAKKRIQDVDSHWEWCEKIESPNYLYMQQMCFSYLHALMLLKRGVRKCNLVLVHAAKLKLYPPFFAGNHPIYQNIIFKDELDNMLMPSKLKTLKDKYVSVSRAGNTGQYQGMLF